MKQNLFRRRFEFTIAVLFFFVLAYAAFAQMSQQQLARDVVRLRVVANSDSQADQQLKLDVRDAILHRVQPLSRQAHSAQEMKQLLEQALPDIVQIAQNEVDRHGCAQEVTATLAFESYPTRDYETFSLPAGQYEGLQVRIGQAQGHNWWCVLYPSLCLDMAEGEERLTEDETALITQDGTQYEIRFAAAELIGSLRAMF